MIGIDMVDIERLASVLQRRPGIKRRLFTAAEAIYCEAHPDAACHLAGTLAVKEAVIKAARLGSLPAWGRRIEVSRAASGAPRARVAGRRGLRFDVSISHEGGYAVAVAMLRRELEEPSQGSPGVGSLDDRRPNGQLVRYLAPVKVSRPSPRHHLVDAGQTFAGSDFP